MDKGQKAVKKSRPYTVCCIVKNLKLNDNKIKEIIDIQEKLHITIGRKRKKLAIGIYPRDKIKMPITFTSKKPEEILRDAGFKIKLITRTSFGVQIDFAKKYDDDDINKVLKVYSIKIKGKSVFIVE
jgi:hypothetical protein